MNSLFCLSLGNDGSIGPYKQHEAVPLEDIQWLYNLMTDYEVPFHSAICILRRTYFPFFYDPHPWIGGTVQHRLMKLLCTITAIHLS